MNDGKCDATGRFWAGSMHVAGTTPVGSLYRLDADGRATPLLDGLTISNGMDWSLDGRTTYFLDTGRHAESPTMMRPSITVGLPPCHTCRTAGTSVVCGVTTLWSGKG
jgi:hypothetical protein